jgi:hypothetical protein
MKKYSVTPYTYRKNLCSVVQAAEPKGLQGDYDSQSLKSKDKT